MRQIGGGVGHQSEPDSAEPEDEDEEMEEALEDGEEVSRGDEHMGDAHLRLDAEAEDPQTDSDQEEPIDSDVDDSTDDDEGDPEEDDS